MPLPHVLTSAPIVWTPTLPLRPPVPICSLRCYQSVRQCQTFWCWAAVLQELLRCLRRQPRTQCQLVEEFLGIRCGCDIARDCDPAILSTCNMTGVLEEFLRQRHLWPGLESRAASDLARDPLCEALNDNAPVVALFVRGGQRHYAVLSGLTTIDGQDYLEVTDPWEGRRIQVPFVSPVKHADGWFLNRTFFIQGVEE